MTWQHQETMWQQQLYQQPQNELGWPLQRQPQEGKVLFCLSSPTFLPLILLKYARLPSDYCITSYFGWQLRWYPGQEPSRSSAAWSGAKTHHIQNLPPEMISKKTCWMRPQKTNQKLQLQITVRTVLLLRGKGNSPVIHFFLNYFHQSQKSSCMNFSCCKA